MGEKTPQDGRAGAKKDPLHGVTLEQILEYLEANLGWEQMAEKVRINCFKKDPSVKSSLKFLRRTPWARTQVEQLYVRQVSRGKGTRRSEPASKRPPAKPPVRQTPGKKDPWADHRSDD